MKFPFVRVLILLLFLVGVGAAEVPAPADWREEIITLPPDFAPDMSWKGKEVLYFSPGMFKPEADDFFSYVFLLKLDEGEPDWDNQLLLYYQGLARAVLDDKNLDTSNFEVSLEGDGAVRYGTLQWIEPFATRKPQTLYLEIRKLGPGHWFFCASPQNPYAPIWTTMRSMRNEMLQP